MIQRTLPICNGGVTYTELKQRCAELYALHSAALFSEVRKNVQIYMDSAKQSEVLDALYRLNELAINLSCMDSSWEEFSTAVFEIVTLPVKPNNSWYKRRILHIFEATEAFVPTPPTVLKAVPESDAPLSVG